MDFVDVVRRRWCLCYSSSFASALLCFSSSSGCAHVFAFRLSAARALTNFVFLSFSLSLSARARSGEENTLGKRDDAHHPRRPRRRSNRIPRARPRHASKTERFRAERRHLRKVRTVRGGREEGESRRGRKSKSERRGGNGEGSDRNQASLGIRRVNYFAMIAEVVLFCNAL